MSDYVSIRNLKELLEGYQKSSMDGTWMPGMADYFERLIGQNDKIINLLQQIKNK